MSTVPVKIKPLVWTRNKHIYPGHDWWTAQVGGLKTIYSISSVPMPAWSTYPFAYTFYTLRGDQISYESLEAAQAAAEAEWDSFIRSAIQTDELL